MLRASRQNVFEEVLKSSPLGQAAEKLAPGRAVKLSGVWGSAAPMLAAALGQLRNAPVLLVTSHLDEADDVADDVEVLTGGAAWQFPAWEVDLQVPQGAEHINDEVAGERLRICNLLLKAGENVAQSAPIVQRPGAPQPRAAPPHPKGAGPQVPPQAESSPTPEDESIRFLVAPIMALLQPVPSKEALAKGRLTLRKGQQTQIEELVAWLVDAGFSPVEQVDQQGEFAHRGGIVDVFPLGATQALRVEFFGDQIESIRRFDLDTQRSTDEIAAYDITSLAARRATDPASTASLLSYLPLDTIVCMTSPAEIRDLAEEVYRRTAESRCQSDQEKRSDRQEFLESSADKVLTGQDAALRDEALSPVGMFTPAAVFDELARFARVEMHPFGLSGGTDTFNMGVRSLERISLNTHEAMEELAELSEAAEVWVFCETPAEEKRFKELLLASHPRLAQAARTAIGHVHTGFYWPAQKLVVVGNHEIFHRYAKLRRIRRVRTGRPLDSLLDLAEGDTVVHVAHGIARFEGLRAIQREGRSEEYLTLRFADNALLHVPASSINLVQKYIGSRQRRPSLSKLGGAGWLRQKQRVTEAVHDLAAELLRVQAMRKAMPGLSFPPTTAWQKQFADEFVYSETEDQIASMQQIEEDMATARPMDRLLCGDVGYGKTELAMRAAFKAAEAGKQVAVLVPTTVLADQHYRTFSERLADYPVHIDVLSRFRRPSEQADILQRLSAGRIDVLIGTHRILSKDVRFADLGLVVIDEEQRFGVAHKEHLKSMRAMVDVLTMTATPIPRTMHMALLGLRDISALATPPLDRRAIHTEVVAYDDSLIRAATLREMYRQGQVFFVHNHVFDIEPLANHLRALVPEARIAVAHGQMPGGLLEKTMLRLVRQEIDVLVCTTIIESGLDIPTANTMIVHNADRFGLAQLHQLRGRVGRYKHRAFCYLLLPQRRSISPDAAKRLKTIEDFSDLGAGFQIAMRDLEIRGAGNILGPEQSGHIATVGYELYCQLLEEAVRGLTGQPAPSRRHVHVELGVDAYIPRSYVPSDRQRMELYRRLAGCFAANDLKQLASDLADAYGQVPPAMQTLLDLAEIRIRAALLGIESIILMEPDLIFSVTGFQALKGLFEGASGTVRLPDEKTVHWRLPPVYRQMPSLINVLLNRLRRTGANI